MQGLRYRNYLSNIAMDTSAPVPPLLGMTGSNPFIKCGSYQRQFTISGMTGYSYFIFINKRKCVQVIDCPVSTKGSSHQPGKIILTCPYFRILFCIIF